MIPGPNPPAAPTNLTAALEAGPQISLAWTDNSLNETGFLIQRSTDGITFSDLASVGPNVVGNVVSYIDPAVTAGSTYTYQVAAFNADGPSAFSNTASATIPALQPPTAPDQLVAVYEPGPPPMINLQWADNSLDETGFVIERSTDGVNFSALATAVANVEAYDDLAVFGGFTYTYRVAAFNANGTSAWTTDLTSSATVPLDATPPAVPSNLLATNVTQTTLTLNWQDNSNNETGFTIQRATNNSFTKNLVTFNVGPDVTFYDDSGLRRNIKYFYRISAFNANFTSPWSPILNVTTPK
jgi:hypothetical protein